MTDTSINYYIQMANVKFMNTMMKSLLDGFKHLPDTLDTLRYSIERNVNKTIIGFKPIRYTPFWCWYRLINHRDYRLDDNFLYQDFWNSINEGQTQMIEDDKWLTYFGAKPEKIYVSAEAYDELVRRINAPPDPEVQEKIRKLMERVPPWEREV